MKDLTCKKKSKGVRFLATEAYRKKSVAANASVGILVVEQGCLHYLFCDKGFIPKTGG